MSTGRGSWFVGPVPFVPGGDAYIYSTNMGCIDMTDISMVVLSGTWDRAAGFLDSVANMSQSIQRLVSADAAVVYSAPFARNYGNEPVFEITNTSITLYGLSYTPDAPFTIVGFVQNITSPEFAPLDEFGNEVVVFDVIPVKYRNQQGDAWIMGGDPEVTPPSVEVLCNPKCRIGDLHITKPFDKHMEIEYNIVMKDTSVVASFGVTFMFSTNAGVTVLEDQPNTAFPTFMRSIFTPGLPLLPLWQYSTSLISDPDGGPSDIIRVVNTDILQVFNITFVAGDIDLFSRTPQISLRPDGFGELDLDLNVFRNGEATFQIGVVPKVTSSLPRWEPEYGGNFNVTFVVIPVNNAPSFTILPNATVLRDEYSTVPFLSSMIIADVEVGPDDEVMQNLTFTILPVSNASLDAFSSPPVLAKDGTL
eukprot:1551815-Rhodomonas_salina.1